MAQTSRAAPGPAASPAAPACAAPAGLRLVSSGEAECLPFLDATLAYPRVTARALRAVADMAAARFYVPRAMLERILREADPVATVSAEAVRFEGFSACCSAYARLDLDDEALARVGRRSAGTTNVDFGREMKQVLARVATDADMRVQIGAEGLAVRHERGAAAEEKVPLPPRWIKGFAEVQHHLAGMEQAFSLGRVATLRFLRSLPRSPDGRRMWVAVRGGSAVATASRRPGAVRLEAPHRLALLEPLGQFASGLDVYCNEALGSSAWVLNLPGQRLVVALNAQAWRGFSGDGALLSALVAGSAEHDARLRAQFNWQTRLEPASLAKSIGLAPEETERALARLAAAGLLGYDLASRSWFHRVLPFDLSRVETLNPRLKAATELAAKGAVTMSADGRSAEVASGRVIHSVHLDEGGHRCTCPWHAGNGTARGPCKHVLAVEIALEGDQA
jgi:hypothetical protein